MIRVYAVIAGLFVFVIALFLSRRSMLSIGMPATWFTTTLALAYASAAVLGMLQLFALRYPDEFWPDYGMFGFLVFLIVMHVVAFSLRTRITAPAE